MPPPKKGLPPYGLGFLGNKPSRLRVRIDSVEDLTILQLVAVSSSSNGHLTSPRGLSSPLLQL